MRNSIISFSKIAFAFLALAGMTTLTSCDDDDEKFVNPKGEKEYNVYFNLGKYNSDENYLEHEWFAIISKRHVCAPIAADVKELASRLVVEEEHPAHVFGVIVVF